MSLAAVDGVGGGEGDGQQVEMSGSGEALGGVAIGPLGLYERKGRYTMAHEELDEGQGELYVVIVGRDMGCGEDLVPRLVMGIAAQQREEQDDALGIDDAATHGGEYLLATGVAQVPVVHATEGLVHVLLLAVGEGERGQGCVVMAMVVARQQGVELTEDGCRATDGGGEGAALLGTHGGAPVGHRRGLIEEEARGQAVVDGGHELV